MEKKILWIDSHCHPQYSPLCEDSIIEAYNNNIAKICCVATTLSEHQFLLNCKERYNTKISLGQHPLDLQNEIDWSILEKNIHYIDAIGETGFDYQGNLQEQLIAFDIQAKLAIKYNLPIIIHLRDDGTKAIEDFAINAIKKYPSLKGVFHCFVGSENLANFAISNNIFMSFSGIITFKKSDELRKVLKIIPHELLLIETDAPYLAPEPLRGKSNHPMYVKYTAEFIANYLNISLPNFSQLMLNNFDKLYEKN